MALARSGSSLIPGFEDVAGILLVCGALVIIFSLLALIGGVFSLQRKLWGLALTGSIFGLFSIGPIFISSILSLVALILVAISRNEFR